MRRIERTMQVGTVLAAMTLASCATATDTTPTVESLAPSLDSGVETIPASAETGWAIAIHGGAGVRSRSALTPELEEAYRSTMEQALKAAAKDLAAGKDGGIAIVSALSILEDSPLFNAGIGGSLDERGDVVHDASIMRGDDRDAGAVAGSRLIKNPIRAAHIMMEETETVLLSGDGADEFARQRSVELADPADFITPRRQQLLERAKARATADAGPSSDSSAFGTVGAVVLDQNGNLFAGTSTGGRTNKRYGRIGDSPIIGAGTFAANESCAVSATGHGEWFIRYTVARDVCAQVDLAGQSLTDAARTVIIDTLGSVGGSGAVISLSPEGDIVFAMNGNGMYRGVARSDLDPKTGIYASEPVK